MELTFKFDSEKKGDLFVAGFLGRALSISARGVIDLLEDEEPKSEKNPLSPENEEHDEQQDTNASEEEEPAKEEDAPAEVQEVQPEAEKPKRKRRTKAEIEAERLAKEAEQSAEQSAAESGEETDIPGLREGETDGRPGNAQAELPFFDPAEHPLNEMTEAEWKDLLLKKRIELGLCNEDGSTVGAKNADARTLFVSYIYELCEPYGASKPKDLSESVRYKFYHEKFKNVQYDPVKGFYLGEPMPTEIPF